MKQSQKNYKRVVIKIGSSLLYSSDDKLERGLISRISLQIADLIKGHNEVMLVSSGAIAMGMSILRLESRPKDLANLQAAAAIGQHELMDVYRGAFRKKKISCAQLLLTWEDFDQRRRYLNARNTLTALLKLRSLPIINENDTVSTDEIKFGDNDKLSALVSILVNADLLVILSDVDGLLDKDKKTVIKLVDKITPQLESLACPVNKKACVGGMLSKIEAARIAVDSGIPCVIANGRKKDIITKAVKDPSQAGTLFMPREILLAEKKRWIAFGAKVKGYISVDEGAKSALINKKSLLSVGVLSSQGDFEAGEIVGVRNSQAREFARGRAGISSRELDKVKGLRHDKEVIHRDNIVIL